MSQASTGNDEKFAREVSRSLNANPRRASALQAILQRAGPIETPIPKRIFSFKSPASRLPITPVSLTSTPTDAHLSGIEDTPPSLSSRQSSDESSSKGTSTLMMLRSSTTRHKPPGAIQANIIDNDTGSNLPQGRKLRGLTNVSVGEADAKSLPPPGPELLKKVDSAKATGEVPVQYESSVVRYVNGKWLAPQMCDSCRILPTITKQSNKLPKCDRGNPCCICTSTGADCPQGKFMTHVFGTRRLSQHLTRQQPGSLKAATGFSLAPHVGQNQNGTWSTSEQTQLREQKTKKRKAEESLMPPIKRRGRPRTTALQKEEDIANLPVDTGDTTDPEIGNGEASSSGDYGTGLRKLSSVDSTPVGSLKRKTATNKSGGSVKYHRSMQEDKPAPYGQPPVWADKRQSLCETLPYYRAYMSGAYLHLQKVRAFMVDKEVGPRDKFEEELIISRVGGGRKLDEQSGHMIQVADQDKNSFALGFQRAMEAKSPVAMIAGQGNRISTSKLPHYYNVLDWFHVTDVWCEKSHGLKCWMVRLEKIRLDTMSWWAPMNSPPLDPNRDINAVKTSTASCSLCKNTSKEIYDAGWACLNTKCDAYFKFSMEIDDKIIEYNKEFMNERTEFTGGPLDPLVPPLLTDGYMEINNNFGYEKSWNAGIVCPMCSGCSRRIEWRQWICETPGCGFTHSVLQRTMKVHDAIARSLAYSKEWFNKETGIKFGQKAMGLYDVYEYILPGEEPDEIAGIIRHFASNGIINGQPDGPNDLFRSMQEKDFGLKRHAARQKDSTGEILTSHFAANWGAPYKYGVTVHSKGFEDAPPVIIKALKRLTWAGQQTLAETVEPFHPFNELLSIGYFEETSIGYHDDGEKELGPTVATLSLGSQALMTLRPKAKCRVGTGSRNAKGTKADVLRMALRHGDLVVMHGTGIQKLYEHAVMPQGMLRFALTCRYVRPELMANDMERLQAEINGKLPNGHEAYAYDGDLGKELIPLDEDLENVSAAQRAMNELSARALAGELNADTLRECQEFLGGLINGMGVPEGRASSPAPSDTPMDDAQ